MCVTNIQTTNLGTKIRHKHVTPKQKEIAKTIGVHFSTLYRELKRNTGKRGYSWHMAQDMCQERHERLPGNRSVAATIKDQSIKYLKERTYDNHGQWH